MRKLNSLWVVAWVAIVSTSIASNVRADDATSQPVKKDVPYVPTPQPVVDRMLDMAGVKKGDKVYDLGCGDGRIVVTAAKKYGATGIGVDIDPQRIAESNDNAKAAGVADKVKFEIKDLFTMDFRDADVLAMYLLPQVNLRLRPRILADMKPGSRVVSHEFDMEDWKPDAEDEVEGSLIYFWTVPAKVEGMWQAKLKGENGKEQAATLNLKQKYQDVTGTANIGGNQSDLQEAKLDGTALSFTLSQQRYKTTVDGKKMSGQVIAEQK